MFRIEIYIRRLLNNYNRSQLLVKMLGLSKSDVSSNRKGLVLIQIDALSKKQLEKAMVDGKMPFLKNLRNKQQYKLYSHYSGMPCSTAAVQAELFYGVKSGVPAFSFLDKQSQRVFMMFNPQDALEIEHRLEKQGKSLLEGGSSYSNIYTGGAAESHFCISNLGLGGILKNRYPFGFIMLCILNFYSLLRIGILMIIEACLAVFDFVRGFALNKNLWKELEFVPSRVAMCVLMRELIVIGAKTDIARDMPVIHLNLMGFHEQSHRRGPHSRFARWTLLGIDDAVRRIWMAAHRPGRDYDVWIYSDHGQIKTTPYEIKFGKSLQDAVVDIFDNSQFIHSKDYSKKQLGFLARAGYRKLDFFTKMFPLYSDGPSSGPIVTAPGPMGHVYFKNKLTIKEMEKFASELLNRASVPAVVMPQRSDNHKGIQLWTQGGCYVFPEQADQILNSQTPFFEEMVRDFIDACHGENSGDLIMCGWQGEGKECCSFCIENGSHGSLSSEEMEGFAMMGSHTEIPQAEKGYLRPLDIRNAALDILNSKIENRVIIRPSVRKNIIRIMTYNVHGCVGMDGTRSSSRIARVISQYDPDVVTLQELDVQRMRSEKEDQAKKIAHYVNMEHHFHASMQVAEELFGDAILSMQPMRLIQKDSLLLRQKKFRLFEPRGALWVEIDFNGKKIQIFNTHLGLDPQERLLHAKELLGPKWLGHPQCNGPMILCGDFNAFPSSRVFKLLNSRLKSVQMNTAQTKHKATWFGRYPVLCLDYIFASQDFEILRVEVCDSYLARLASDHRPIIADLKIL